jgi:hypothetical protein
MAEKGIREEEILEEREDCLLSNSKRSFTVKGSGWFVCPSAHQWSSDDSWCMIDLREQTIRQRTKQMCVEMHLTGSASIY